MGMYSTKGLQSQIITLVKSQVWIHNEYVICRHDMTAHNDKATQNTI